MIEIQRRTVKRVITEQEFKRLKKLEPWATYRQRAKSCFSKGTEILTTVGYQRIEDFVPPINSGLVTPIPDGWFSFKAINPQGEEETIQATYYGETTEWVEFTLQNGDILKVTPDHNMVIWRGGERMIVEARNVLGSDQFEAHSKHW